MSAQFFWDVLKKIKDRAQSFLLVKDMGKGFSCNKILSNTDHPFQNIGRRSCYFVLLIYTYVTLIKCRRKLH